MGGSAAENTNRGSRADANSLSSAIARCWPTQLRRPYPKGTKENLCPAPPPAGSSRNRCGRNRCGSFHISELCPSSQGQTMATVPTGMRRPLQGGACSQACRTTSGAAGHRRRVSRTQADNSGCSPGARSSRRTASCRGASPDSCHSSIARLVAVVSCPAPRICNAFRSTAPSGMPSSTSRSSRQRAAVPAGASLRRRSAGARSLFSRPAAASSSRALLRRSSHHVLGGTPSRSSKARVTPP
mmetsp:Transcript_66740/g.180441  ORF Transcript_66740/g.180441 Transcript_66740/m.180441 type:complete len:242 (-) Transcript_66740:57-782(-)